MILGPTPAGAAAEPAKTESAQGIPVAEPVQPATLVGQPAAAAAAATTVAEHPVAMV